MGQVVTEEPEKNRRDTGSKGRGKDGKFVAGVSGNANGRPKGVPNRSTLMFQGLVDEQGLALIKKAVEMALGGDSAVMRMLLGLLLPPRRDRHVALDLPEIRSAEDALNASRTVVEAIAVGTLTPSEGGELARAIEAHAKLYAAVEIERGITELEQVRGLAS
jgi:hypothetical protein